VCRRHLIGECCAPPDRVLRTTQPRAIFVMSTVLELNCWILGDEPQCVFPVKIASSETVGHLKEAIKDKKKQTFTGIDADLLDLWKVSNLIQHTDNDEFIYLKVDIDLTTDSDPHLLEMIQVNCSAVVHLTRLYLPVMVGRKHGDVLIVASLAAFFICIWGMGAISLALYRRVQPVIAPNIPSVPMGPGATPLPPQTTVGGI